jgi:hypothetical protein
MSKEINCNGFCDDHMRTREALVKVERDLNNMFEQLRKQQGDIESMDHMISGNGKPGLNEFVRVISTGIADMKAILDSCVREKDCIARGNAIKTHIRVIFWISSINLGITLITFGADSSLVARILVMLRGIV